MAGLDDRLAALVPSPCGSCAELAASLYASRCRHRAMTARDTNQALAEITDEGLFERVATAVLRIAESRCTALSHPGVNAEGKTRKSPLDGIGFVPDADPPHLIAVHHTTTPAASLKKNGCTIPRP
jgi:hypothetical protein